MIEIKNLRTENLVHPYDVRVDRVSALGNRYYMKREQDRDAVCEKYETYFNDVVNNVATGPLSGALKAELLRLIGIHKEHGKLRLFCWCSPKRCHAEVIRKYIIEHPEETSHGQ